LDQRKAELVTMICKEIEKQGYSLLDILNVFAAVIEFLFQTKREGQ